MAARFSPAVIAMVRDREALARALDEQEKEEARRRLIFRSLVLGLPIAGAYYVMTHPDLSILERFSLKTRKRIVKKMESQIQDGNNVFVGGKPSGDEMDDALAGLEARTANMNKVLSQLPKANITEEQLMKMSGKAERARDGLAETGEAAASISAGARERTDAADAAADGGETSPKAPVQQR